MNLQQEVADGANPRDLVLSDRPKQAGRLGLDIFTASARGWVTAVARLLEVSPAMAQERSPEGYTPLHLALRGGHIEVAGLLLSRGADVNARNPWGGTALHTAAVKGQLRVVELLLDHGADHRARNLWKKTPRERALEAGHREMAARLR